MLHGFSDQVARFATTRDEHARVRANIDRRVDELRVEYAGIAVECLRMGSPEAALEVMLGCLAEQADVAKIRLLEVVPWP